MKNILIADDHPMISLGLERTVTGIVGECSVFVSGTFHETWELVESLDLFLVILDLNIPGSATGAEMISSVREAQKNALILVYSGRDELLYAPLCLRAGASGFVHKTASREELQEAILTIIRDKKYLSPRLQEEIIHDYPNETPRITGASLRTLSPREREILDMVLSGLTTKEISNRLQLKYSTVSTHKDKILSKMKAENFIDLVKKMSWNDV